MYRLLIVDDEPYIANGIYDLLQGYEQYPLELIKSYHAPDALKKLQDGRIDIMITDINMPVMDGIELHRRVQQIWPRCKVIFLTGYAEFAYIQEATRTGGVVDYLLKNESEMQLLSAVGKAIAELDDELERHSLLEQSRFKLRQALPYLRSAFLAEVLEGRPMSVSQLDDKLEELEIHLDPDKPFVIMLGKAVDPGNKFTAYDMDLLAYSIRNIVTEFVSQRAIQIVEAANRSTLIWLVQPGDGITIEETIHYIYGTMETVQACCSKLLGSLVSFAVGSAGVGWQTAPAVYSRLVKLLMRQSGSEEALIMEPVTTMEESHRTDEGKQEFQMRIQHLDTLRNLLETGQEQEFIDLLDEQFKLEDVEPNEYATQWLVGLYYVFVSFINQYGLNDIVSERVSLSGVLPKVEPFDWRETAARFRSIATAVFQSVRSTREETVHHTVKIARDYVEAHMAEDLSLTRVSAIVYHSPTYFSKLFKQSMGLGFNEYVSELRLSKARSLLVGTNMKVQDIAHETGYESATYFAKAFRRKFGLSPQEYRDRYL